MECFDCSEQGHRAASVAICQDCGAALCGEHVTAVEHLPHRVAGMGRATPPAPARRMTCHTCRRARRLA
ncbi:DUF2180 family protein [Streptomyces sp. NPDC059002]|uniref:DUF2180 family protein n=1 Tax=Streptomyces sp. NPDC059002 TaxID=3346690 RepID=UPI0036ACBCE2